MPRGSPPAICPGRPVLVPLAAGTVLYRLHSSALAPDEFNVTISSDPRKGGRFDSNDGSYSYLYAGEDLAVAIAETLVRDLPFGPAPPRIIPFAHVMGRKLSAITIGSDLDLVGLHGANLGQVGQDTWLTKCPAADYPLTREWAKSIREWVPTAQGFVWRASRDEDRFAHVLFGDRVSAGAISGTVKMSADSGAGLILVRAVLQKHNVTL